MRSRISISLLALVLAAVALWFRLASPPGDQRADMQGVTDRPLQQTSPSPLKEPSGYLSNQLTQSQLSNSSLTERDLQLERAVRGVNVPINFFGMTVDQDSKPIAAATVKLVARNTTYLQSQGPISTSPAVELITDASGRFEWTKGEGDVLRVETVEKSGYELEPNTKRDYPVSSGTHASPIVFRMWNTNIYRELISGEKEFQIVPDGRLYGIDLSSGKLKETGDGDFQVWIKCPEQLAPGQTYEWSSGIQMTNGGLLEETNVYSSMFSAPSEGYVSTFLHSGPIRSGQRGTTGERRFFLRLQNGREYGRMTVGLYAPYNRKIRGLIHLQYTIEPSGSQILR